MMSKRRQILITIATLSILALFLRYRDAVVLYQAELQRHDPDNLDSSSNSEDEVVAGSIFQLWRAHQPNTATDTVTQACGQLVNRTVKQSCSQRLRRVRSYCSAAQKRKEENDLKDKEEEEEEEEEEGKKKESEGDEGGDDEGRSRTRASAAAEDSVVDVFSYKQRNETVMYCSVHKTASTFWIRLFRFLHADTGGRPVASPEALSKYRVHLTPFAGSRPLALAYLVRQIGSQGRQFRFMFTRNPYRRLWSVYVDKFVLPDFYYWSVHAAAILEMKFGVSVHKHPYNNCGSVSFDDFVRYVVQDPSSPSSAPTDDHLLPVSKKCNPCAFQPHFIGRVENLTQDSQAVLQRLGLAHLVRSKDFQGRALDQIRTVTEFVHDTVVGRGSLRHCVTDDELQSRLILAFTLNGFLPDSVADVRRDSVASSASRLVSMMQDLFTESRRGQEQVQTQRDKFFVNAFARLPRTLLLKVRDFYQEDFEAFGYEAEPAELFSH